MERKWTKKMDEERRRWTKEMEKKSPKSHESQLAMLTRKSGAFWTFWRFLAFPVF